MVRAGTVVEFGPEKRTDFQEEVGLRARCKLIGPPSGERRADGRQTTKPTGRPMTHRTDHGPRSVAPL